jgi:hypothetical protein
MQDFIERAIMNQIFRGLGALTLLGIFFPGLQGQGQTGAPREKANSGESQAGVQKEMQP